MNNLMMYLKQSIQAKMVLPIVIGAALALGLSLFIMFQVKAENTELVGLSSAKAMANQVSTLRTFYTAEVVTRARKSGMAVNYDFAQKDDTLPLPATLVKVLGEEIRKTYPGTSVRLYSRYPFPHRAATEKYDEFEQQAMTALERDPLTPFHRMEPVNGRLSLRYAMADVMRPACISCHNSHPESPKRDWREGDVRGVVEVIVPVEQAEAGLLAGTRNIGLATVGGLALLAIGLLIVFRRTVMRPVQSLVAATTRVDQGDFSARAQVVSQDELGAMAATFNTMLDHTEELVQSREQERDALQAAIMKLISEVSDVGQGDLTAEAEVTMEATGALADAFNYMISELRQVVSQVQEAAFQVYTSVDEINLTAEQLSQGSRSQSAQVVTTTAAIGEMAASIQQVSQNAVVSASVAEQALQNAQRGARAVEKAIGGMSGIQEQVGRTAETIKRLGERSEEIGEIAGLIGSIARRTSVLALSSAAQAAMTGKVGDGFAPVSREVEHLAESTNEAANHAGALIGAIRSEIHRAIVAMEGTLQEVAKGAEITREAGQALREIESVSGHLSEAVGDISSAANRQAQSSEAVAKAMGEISTVIQEATGSISRIAASINNLTTMADVLRASVSRFKLSKDGARRRR